jgi:hypothetical protein
MIDWTKVAVIYNSQYANSQDVAEYYADARGINPAFVQGYDLGTGLIAGTTNAARDTFRNGPLTAIRDFCTENSIEAVAVSICCPRRYGYNPEYVLQQGEYDTKQYSAFCRAITDADRIVTLGGTRPAKPLLRIAYQILSFGGTKTTSCMRLTDVAGNLIFDWRGADLLESYRHILCGRLGHAAETLATDDVALAKRCIDDALWYEINGDPTQSPIMFGMSTRIGGLSHGNVYAAYRSAINTGLKNLLTYDGNFNNNPDSKWAADDWGYSEPTWTIPDTGVWFGGGGPIVDIWGCVGTGLENNAGAVGNLPVNSVNIQRGAWVFESTSSNVSGVCIPHGLTAAVCPVQEPYGNGVPEISGLFHYLLMGFSIEEACVMSCEHTFSSSTEVWGDPFYTPFKRLKFGNAGQGMGVN